MSLYDRVFCESEDNPFGKTLRRDTTDSGHTVSTIHNGRHYETAVTHPDQPTRIVARASKERVALRLHKSIRARLRGGYLPDKVLDARWE